MASENKMTLKEAASVLGISPNASKAEINKASRQLIARYHPDAWRGKPPAEQKKAEQKFMQVNAAKKIMLDPSLAAPEAGQMPSGAQQGGVQYGQGGTQRQYGGGSQQGGGYGNQYGQQRGGQQANPYGTGQQAGGGNPYATRQQRQRAQQQRPNYGQNVGYDGRRGGGASYSQQTGQTDGYGGGYGNDGRFTPQQSASRPQPQQPRFNRGVRQPDPFEDLRSPRQSTGGSQSSHEKFNQSTSFASSFGQQPDPQERQIADQIRTDVKRRYKQPADVIRSSASMIATLAFIACAIYVIVMTVTGTPLTSFEDIGSRLTGDALPAFVMVGIGIVKLIAYDLILSYYIKRATDRYVNDGTRVGVEMAVLGAVGLLFMMGNAMATAVFGVLIGVGIVLAVIAVVVRRVSVRDAESSDADAVMAHLMG